MNRGPFNNLSCFFQMDLKDKIVSPVIWQPGQKPLHSHGHHHGHGRNQKFRERKNSAQQQAQPNFRAKDASFQYGNFNRFVSVLLCVLIKLAWCLVCKVKLTNI